MKQYFVVLSLLVFTVAVHLEAQRKLVDYVNPLLGRAADQSGGYRIQTTVACVGRTCLPGRIGT
jgi:hypothetical protein